MQGPLQTNGEAIAVSRPRSMMERAEVLLADAATRPDALRLFAKAGLATRNPSFAAGALAELASITPFDDADRLLAAQTSLLGRRFDEVRGIVASPQAAPEVRVELALVRAAAALALGDVEAAAADLGSVGPEGRKGVDPVLLRRFDWAATYVASTLGRPVDRKAYGRNALAERWAAPAAPRADVPTIAIMDYRSYDLRRISLNIGDYVQTLASMRHLARYSGITWRTARPEISAMMERLASTWPAAERSTITGEADLVVLDRDQTWPARTLWGDRVVWMVMNGWYSHDAFDVAGPFPGPSNLEPILISFHLSRPQDLVPPMIDWLRRHAPVGCRDWATVETLLGAGIDAFFSGCLTTTLSVPEDAGRTRRGRFRVDVEDESDETTESVVHRRDEIRSMAFHEALEAALSQLETYAGAEEVATNRLHCWLPCRALGTPVTFAPIHPGDRRMEGLVGLDEAGFAALRARLSRRVADVLDLVLAGRSRAEVREAWRAQCADDVRAARLRVFGDETVAAGPRHPPKDALPGARPETVTVTLAFDDRLLERALPFVRSLRAGTRAPLRLVLLTRGLSKDRLAEVIAAAEAVDVRHFAMDDRLDDVSVRLNRGTTISTMDRLYLADLLPDLDRIVYLDVDTVCLGDVAELAAFEPSRLGVAARPTPMTASNTIAQIVEVRTKTMDAAMASDIRRWVAAEADFTARVFNAGVLVLSLDRLRSTGTMKRALDLVVRWGLHDQDALNLACGGDYTALPMSWNAMPYADWFHRAHFLHWAGDVKPWSHGRGIRMASLWRAFAGGEAATSVGSSEYWRDETHYPKGWDERARMAMEWIEGPQRALDLGCGPRMILKSLLPPGSDYRGADLRAWSDDVEAVDLNEGQFPAGTWDTVFMLGVSEYLQRPGVVYNKIRRAADRLIVSYCHPKPCFDRAGRQQKGWINAISEERFVEILEKAGWSVHATRVFNETADFRQIIYETRVADGRVRAPVKPTVQLSDVCRTMRAERLTYLRPEKLVRLEAAANEAVNRSPGGDVAEFGVALGGSGIVLAGIARSGGRRFLGFDVFAMIPPPTSERDGPDAKARYAEIVDGKSRGLGGDLYYGYQTGLRDKVADAFARHGLPVDGTDVALIEGTFETTLPVVDPKSLAFAHIDCDWYDPVAFCLREVARRLAPGGVIVVDDYHDWSGCRVAVDEFLTQQPDFVLDDGPNVILRRRA